MVASADFLCAAISVPSMPVCRTTDPTPSMPTSATRPASRAQIQRIVVEAVKDDEVAVPPEGDSRQRRWHWLAAADGSCAAVIQDAWTP